MLSAETLQQYREMTPGQRLRLTLDMMEVNQKFLLMGTADQIRRKFELLERENDARNLAMLAAIAQSEKALKPPR